MHLIILLLAICCFNSTFSHSDTPPELTLAQHYSDSINLQHYWVSEKLDGVRAYWDGKSLISRQGNIFHAPNWFLEQLPDIPLDGELWLARGRFEKTLSIIRKQKPIDHEWQQIKYMIFDLPNSNETFDTRLQLLHQLLTDQQGPAQLIAQVKVATHQQLQQKLSIIDSIGGEGLMLHRGSALYTAGRTKDLLKLKTKHDAEAIVVGYRTGKGKFKGQLGSILVQLKNGKKFYIGSGFSNQQRQQPPEVGTVITFKHNGFTHKGIPRHASFLRIRSDHDL